MKTLGDKIRYFRNLRGWSQETFANKLSISLPAYSKIERNVTDVGYKRLKQISKVLGITEVELLSVSSSGPKGQNEYEKIIAEKEREISKLQKRIIDLLDSKK